MRTKSPAFLIAILLLAVSMAALLSPIAGAAQASLPINIGNNAELTLQAHNSGWPGNGTSSNPYVIANLAISAGGSGAAISIANTNAHLIIEGCALGQATYGVYTNNVSNLTVEGNQLSTAFGAFLVETTNSTVTGNSITGSDDGIHMGSSSNITVSQNTISGVGDVRHPPWMWILPTSLSPTIPSTVRRTTASTRMEARNSLSNNSIISAQFCGVFLDFDTSFNNVTNNTITGAASEGVYSNGTSHLISET